MEMQKLLDPKKGDTRHMYNGYCDLEYFCTDRKDHLCELSIELPQDGKVSSYKFDLRTVKLFGDRLHVPNGELKYSTFAPKDGDAYFDRKKIINGEIKW